MAEITWQTEKMDEPSREFWEDALEFNIGHARKRAAAAGGLHRWIGKLSGRQLRILSMASGLSASASARAQRRLIVGQEERLLPFYCVDHFGKGKSEAAVVDVARGVLPSEWMEICRKGERKHQGKSVSETDYRYDKPALLFALYHHDWQLLREVLHFDKVHKKGFASMVLGSSPPGKPKSALSAFLTMDEVARITTSLKRFRMDGNAAKVQGVTVKDGRPYVFVRRTDSLGHVHTDGKVVHGLNAEWIVLDFSPDGRQVNIASKSISESLELADAIATAHFGVDCRYANEEKLIEGEKIRQFVATVRAGSDGVGLVEINLNASPLQGSCAMRLSHQTRDDLVKSLDHFEDTFGPLLESLPQIEWIKVLYKGKRVSLRFEESETVGKEYVVRYTDHRLNGFERRAFEQQMRNQHGIPVLSTEKRYRA